MTFVGMVMMITMILMMTTMLMYFYQVFPLRCHCLVISTVDELSLVTLKPPVMYPIVVLIINNRQQIEAARKIKLLHCGQGSPTQTNFWSFRPPHSITVLIILTLPILFIGIIVFIVITIRNREKIEVAWKGGCVIVV